MGLHQSSNPVCYSTISKLPTPPLPLSPWLAHSPHPSEVAVRAASWMVCHSPHLPPPGGPQLTHLLQMPVPGPTARKPQRPSEKKQIVSVTIDQSPPPRMPQSHTQSHFPLPQSVSLQLLEHTQPLAPPTAIPTQYSPCNQGSLPDFSPFQAPPRKLFPTTSPQLTSSSSQFLQYLICTSFYRRATLLST